MKKDSALERLVYRMVTRNLDKHSIDNYTDAVKKQEAFATTTAFQTIDTKATGLLTYVAMMIAGLGLVAPLVADSDLEIGIIIAEMTAYLLIAVGCLRCLSVVGGRDVSGAGEFMGEIFELGPGLAQRGSRHHHVGLADGRISAARLRRVRPRSVPRRRNPMPRRAACCCRRPVDRPACRAAGTSRAARRSAGV